MPKTDMVSKHRWNVLVFPGGTEVGLEIWRALKGCKEVRLFSAASTEINHAQYVFSHHTVIPDVRESGWLEALNQVIKKHAIDYIFPAHAYVIDALSKARAQLSCPVIMAAPDVIELTRSKRRTLAALKDVLPVPDCYVSPGEVKSYPVFIKPERSYGGQEARMIYSQAELSEAIKRAPDVMIQEFLPGREYTVDCFSDSKGTLMVCVGRQRQRVRMGTSMHAALAGDALQAQFKKTASAVLTRIPLTGAWFFQLKEDAAGSLKLLEVEARIAGTMALNRARGINFPLLSLYQASGESIKIVPNDYALTLDRALVNRYAHLVHYDTVYVDWDDTLLLHGKLNTELVRFLYQCVNKNIKLILLSKSLQKDKSALLKKWRLTELFDEVHWLAEAESKADYITAKNAIVIEDSFSQRCEILARRGIPTFDPSMVEMLLDERE